METGRLRRREIKAARRLGDLTVLALRRPGTDGRGRDRPVHTRPHCHRARFALYPRTARPDGPVAQWLEPAAHNGLVAGSSPARPTRQNIDIAVFSASLNIPDLSDVCARKVQKGPARDLKGRRVADLDVLRFIEDGLRRSPEARHDLAEECPPIRRSDRHLHTLQRKSFEPRHPRRGFLGAWELRAGAVIASGPTAVISQIKRTRVLHPGPTLAQRLPACLWPR